MQFRLTSGALAATASLWLSACGEARGGEQHRESADVNGPSLVEVVSLPLDEPDSVRLGGHTAFFTVGSGRDVFVTDMDDKRILRFSPDGRMNGVYGKEGGGPGEFELPAVIGLIAGDSILVVADVNRSYLSLFDVASGEYLRGLALPARDIGAGWTARGDTIYFAVNMGPSLVMAWPWRSDTVDALGVFPSRLHQALPVTIRHGRTEAVVTDSGFIVMLPTEPGLHLLGPNGEPEGFVPIPAARRRGVPADLVPRQLAELDAKRYGPLGSSTAALHQLSSGQLAVVHYDVDFVGDFPTGRFDNFRTYVTLLTEDLTMACLDGVVPLAMDDFSIPVFVGDTMFVLVRNVTDDDRVENVVRGFLISDQSCDWIPTGRSAA